MNYVLTSYRKVNKLNQGCAVRLANSSLTEHNSYVKMKSWASLLSGLDKNTWTTGTIKYSGLCSSLNGGNNNNGEKADVDITVCCMSSVMPKMVNFRLEDVTQSNFVTKVEQRMLSIFEVVDGDCIVVNASFDLKNGV